MATVTTSAPGKLMLLGDHAVVYGHPCLVTAVDQRMYVTVHYHDKPEFILSAPDVGLERYVKAFKDLGGQGIPKAVRFLETALIRFQQRYPDLEGVSVETKSDFSSLFGFGSSSAVTVAFIHALAILYGLKLTHKELFDMCYQVVMDVQGVGSGFDIAAAIWGGTIYYIAPAAVVVPIAAQNLPLIVGYSGNKADTATIVRMVESQRAEDEQQVNAVISSISAVVQRGKTSIEQEDWKALGKCFQENQQLLRQLHVSTEMLDRLCSVAENAGAYGAKLSGAGGGDCMIALAENTAPVNNALTQAGGIVLDVQANASGVRIEHHA